MYTFIIAILDSGYEHAEKADLCLAMGSSLTVTPAAEIPEVKIELNLWSVKQLLFPHSRMLGHLDVWW